MMIHRETADSGREVDFSRARLWHYGLPIEEMVEKGHYNPYVCCDAALRACKDSGASLHPSDRCFS